jgi:hypothetical protein
VLRVVAAAAGRPGNPKLAPHLPSDPYPQRPALRGCTPWTPARGATRPTAATPASSTGTASAGLVHGGERAGTPRLRHAPAPSTAVPRRSDHAAPAISPSPSNSYPRPFRPVTMGILVVPHRRLGIWLRGPRRRRRLGAWRPTRWWRG